jgi:probable rRNA maturation factor
MTPGDRRSRLLVSVTDERGRVRSAALARWLASAAPRRARGAVNVALVSDARVRALNRQYRRKDYATDVLSFPATPVVRSAPSESLDRTGFLGDIVIARGVARRQAREAGHGERTEWRVLALHASCISSATITNGTRAGCCASSAVLRRKGGLREGP